ncbi:MAG: hypothetical protein HFF45_07355 [Lawsonibacter sp.]|nr:hypothetical protein [Lawsonibacter sp.]
MANDGTVKIGVDFSADDIKRGYKTIQDEGKKTANSLKSVNNALKLDPKNVDLLTEKQKLLTKAVASSELEVSELTKELEKAKASGMDETDAEGYRELVLALSEATVEAQQYNAELREINQELNFDHGSADVLVEKQRLLTKALAEAEAQASELSEALEQAREAGLDSEDAEGYRELSEALEQAQQQARQYADELENLSENTDECTDDTDSLSESLAGSVLAGQLAAESFGFLMEKIGELVQWVLNLNEATEEYRVAQAKLNTAFEAAGYSADVANQAFSSFYGILGDIDTAAEASQLLASLARSEEDVAKWTQIAAGVYGTFGDALPIEGLIEAANETAKTGQVTGVLADALNWAGESEDAFNESLALLNDEGKRAELIMNNLGIIYGETGDIFRENNETIMESREANLRFQESMSRLAESIQPFLTTLTQMATTFMDWFNGIPDGAQAAVVGVVAFLAVISPIAGIITAITGALGAAGIASTTFSIAGTAVSLTLGQWVIVIGVVIAAVLALAAAIAFLTGRGKELQSMKMPEVPDYSGAVQGGGRRSGGPSLQSDGPSAAPMALSDGDTASSPLSRAAPALETAMPTARSRVISDLAAAMPAAQSRVAIATADMAPSAAYSSPPPASYGASGNDSGRQTPIIVRPNIHIHFDGDLAQFAQVFKPVIDAEDARVGVGVQ